MIRSRILTHPHPGNFLIQSVIELADWQLSRITQEYLNSKRPSSEGHNPNLNHLVDIASKKSRPIRLAPVTASRCNRGCSDGVETGNSGGGFNDQGLERISASEYSYYNALYYSSAGYYSLH